MPDRLKISLAIALSGAILFVALRYGFIGGAGTGAYRKQNPINFWLGVGVTSLMFIGSIAVMVSTFITGPTG